GVSAQSLGIDFVPDALVHVKGRSGQLQLSSGSLVIQGPADLDVVRVDADGVDGAINMGASVASGLGGTSELAKFDSFDLSGKSASSGYKGSVNGIVREFGIGHAEIESGAVLDGMFNKAGDLPVNVKTTQPGRLAFLVGEGSGTAFEAKLTNAV